MKKIGVLTFHRSMNYGAVLQAFGLVKSLERLGGKTELLDYRNIYLENQDSIRRFYKTTEILRFGYQILDMPFWFLRRKRFNSFLNLANMGERILDINETIESNYSKFVVGSDQVWNYKVTGLDENYFFKNVKDKRKIFSYAASFGIADIPEDLKSEYIKGLERFNRITVREERGAEIIEDLIGKRPEVVIDPSLLLSLDEWKTYINDKPFIDGEYIVIYQRAYSKSLIEFAKDLSNKTGCKIITINGNPRQRLKAKNIKTAGPIEFLNIFYHANYIVTNSFHGVAFSLNLNKEFYIELLDKKFGVNSRLENIINQFNINDRKINLVNLDTNLESPDFEKINEELSTSRSKAFNYITNMINDN